MVVEVKARVCRLAVGAGLVSGSACVTDSIEHGSDSSATMTTGASDSTFGATSPSTTEAFFGDTNFPEPAITHCGGLENMALPIDDMISAWGVVALPGAVDGSGPVAPGSVRIRLGEQPIFECRQSLDPEACGGSTSDTGTSGSTGGGSGSGGGSFNGCGGWGLAFTLTETEATPGEHELALLEQAKFEVANGEGFLDVEQVEGSLDIFRVTPDCIVGRIDGAAFNGGIDHPDFQGGFVAQLCQSTCVPFRGHECL